MLSPLPGGIGVKLCVDGSFWGAGSPPSARHVTRDLVKSWASEYPDDELTVVVPHSSIDEVSAISPSVSAVPVRRILNRVPQAATAMSLGWGTKCDAVITHNFASLAPGVVRACLVHDALFVDHPEWFTRVERLYFNAIRPALRSADVVLTTSQTESDRIARVWPETSERIHPIGLASASDVVNAVSREPDNAPQRNFILAVGRINTRKNLARLIDAYQLFRSSVPNVDLIIVGGRDGRIDTLADAQGVSFTGHVDDAELRWYYERCSLFCFPSLGEGYGLPLIEAANLGARIVCSELPVFRELNVADDYFDPLDVQDIAAVLERNINAQSEIADQTRLTDSWTSVVARARTALMERLT